MPLLSILVPVYNEAATVAAVIRRLRDVPFPVDREIIVVNDGSGTSHGRARRAGRSAGETACTRCWC